MLLHTWNVRKLQVCGQQIDYSHGTLECDFATTAFHMAIICHGIAILILECCLTSSSDCTPRVLLQGLYSLSPLRVASSSPSQFSGSVLHSRGRGSFRWGARSRCVSPQAVHSSLEAPIWDHALAQGCCCFLGHGQTSAGAG